MYPILIGDLHGNTFPIWNFSKIVEQHLHLAIEDVLIILLGDAGLNYYYTIPSRAKKDVETKNKLQEIGFQYMVIRGNHEDRPSNMLKQFPEKWHKESRYGGTGYVESLYPNIFYCEDYPSVYNIYGYSTLVIPGAYSVDKFYRLKRGWPWFPDEQLTDEEMERGRALIKNANSYFDIILSHTCPIVYEPTDLFIDCIDQSLVDTTMERYLGEIERRLEYKLWAWGHYHATRVYPDNGDKQCIMLYDNQFFDVMNYFRTRDPYISLLKIQQQEKG